jgi:hypothetical protein
MPNAVEAIEARMRLISNTIYSDGLYEAKIDADSYIDALRDFHHITEDEHSNFQKETERLLNERAEQLKHQEESRRSR